MFGHSIGICHQAEESFFEGEAILFNDRLRQNFAGDPIHFGPRFVFRNNTVESDFEILSLPHFLQAFVADFS